MGYTAHFIQWSLQRLPTVMRFHLKLLISLTKSKTSLESSERAQKGSEVNATAGVLTQSSMLPPEEINHRSVDSLYMALNNKVSIDVHISICELLNLELNAICLCRLSTDWLLTWGRDSGDLWEGASEGGSMYMVYTSYPESIWLPFVGGDNECTYARNRKDLLKLYAKYSFIFSS